MKSENLFETLYNLAKQKDKKGLENFIDSGVFLSEWFGRQRLVHVFAKENNTEIVDFLLHEFELDINAAAEGYAYAGNTAAVKQLLNQGASEKYVVNGYAQGGHKKQLQRFFYDVHLMDNMVDGYAQGGYDEEVENLLRRGAEIDFAAFGYAWVGAEAKVNRMLQRGADINYAIRAYAWGGHSALVNNLLRRREKDSLVSAISGYAKGGFDKEIKILEELNGGLERMKAREPNYLSFRCFSFALGGHWQLCKTFSSKEKDKIRSLEGFLKGQHFAQINCLLRSEENQNRFLKKFKNMLSDKEDLIFLADYSNSKASSQIKRLISFFDFPLFQSFSYEVMVKKNLLKGINKKSALAYLNNLNKIQRTYHLTYPEAGWALKPFIQVWFLQGIQLIKKNKIDKYSFLIISTFLMGFSYENTVKFFEKYKKKSLPSELNLPIEKEKSTFFFWSCCKRKSRKKDNQPTRPMNPACILQIT